MIQLFCPSRGRPHAAGELLASFNATKTRDDTHLIFLVDEDDPTKEEYPGLSFYGPVTGDPTGPLNWAALACETGIVGFIGDDSRCETKGWDELVRVALKTPGFAWGDDGHAKPWPSTVFVSKPIVDRLGYLALPTLHRGFFDAVWVWLAELTGTKNELPMMFRHVNPPGVQGAATPEVIASDEAAFIYWQQNQMRDDAKKVRAVVNDYFFGEVLHA